MRNRTAARSAARLLAIVAAGAISVSGALLKAESVAVRYAEGTVHGFLTVRTLTGEAIGDGELIQSVRASQVTSRMLLRFHDGSLHDETAVFSQRRQFRLLKHHLLQKGPSFPRQIDMSIDGASGQVAIRSADDGKEEKQATERLDLPLDLANGLMPVLLKNVDPEQPPKSFSFVAATPKPRLVKLLVSASGKDRFTTGDTRREATHYVLKVDIGGLSGLLAPLVGKQPEDSHVWIMGGDTPAFVKSEQALYVGGPILRIETVSPSWPNRTPGKRSGWF